MRVWLFLLCAWPAWSQTIGPRDFFLPVLRREAVVRGVPPGLADAVAEVESGYAPGAVGRAGEVGMMQILPATAAMLGFRGTPAELFAPRTNLRYGLAYLARAWAASDGDVCRALMKYRAGLGEEAYSPRSVEYCRRAQDWLARTGAPLAAAPPVELARVQAAIDTALDQP